MIKAAERSNELFLFLKRNVYVMLTTKKRYKTKENANSITVKVSRLHEFNEILLSNYFMYKKR